MTRLLLILVGVAIGVASVSVAATLPSVVTARAERAGSRLPLLSVDPALAKFRFQVLDDSVNDRPWLRVVIGADTHAPAPPGLTAVPGTGQTYASPALIAAARASASLARRLGPITGVIGPSGLQGPDEAVSYTGAAAADLKEASVASGYGGEGRDVPDAQSATTIATELVVLIGGPALLFLLTCSRLSAATRTRRLAALRLVGLSRRQLLGVAGIEAALAGFLGAVAGLLLYRIISPTLASSGILGIAWYPGDFSLGWGASALVVAAIAVLAGRFGAIGMGRVLTHTTDARRTPGVAHGGVLRLLPLVGGLITLLGFYALTLDHAERTYGPSSVNVVVGGAILAVGGLLLGLAPMCSRVAGLVAPRSRWLAVRLGSRRLQHESSSLVRVVTGLVLMVMVAGLGQAILRSAALAAGAEATTQSVQIPFAGVPLAARQRVVDVHALARIATIPAGASDGTPMGAPAPGGSGVVGPAVVDGSKSQTSGTSKAGGSGAPPPANGAGVSYSTCQELRDILRQTLSTCADGRTFRLEAANPAIARNAMIAGTALQLPGAGGATTPISVPVETLTIANLESIGVLSTNSLLVTSRHAPGAGWPERTMVTIIVGASDSDLGDLKASLAAIAPTLRPTVQSRDIGAMETYRVHRGAVDLGIFIGFLLGVLTFLISTIDRALERRTAVATLVVLGTRAKTLRWAQIVQLAIPLAIGLGTAVLITHLAATGYLIVSDAQIGPSLQPLYWGIAMTAVALLVALSSATFVPGLRPRADELRRE